MMFKVSTPVLIIGAVAVYFMFFRGNSQNLITLPIGAQSRQEPTNYGA